MEGEDGDHEAYQSSSSLLISGMTKTRAQPPPEVSPSSINLCRAYHAGRSRDTQMLYFEEDDVDEEDFDYEEEEEQEDDEDEGAEEDDDADEEEGVETINMGSFSEPGRKFLSKVWKEYEPVRDDGIVVAAECKHCARSICAGRKHGTSSLRKHLKRCKERKKILRVSGQLSASIMSPDGVSMGLWTFNQALARRELMRMIVLHELAFSLVEYDGFRRFVSSLNPSFKMICRKTVKEYWKMTWLSLCIPVILDPQFKLKYLEYRFAIEFGSEAVAMIAKIKNVFQGLFKEYLQLSVNGADPMSQGGEEDIDVTDQDPMADWDKHVNLSASINVDSGELDSYLSKVPIRRSDQFNILAWWQMNSVEYPILSRMAADILAAPASSVASESAFSTGKRVLSDFRSRMAPKTLEALVCLQDWIRATTNTERSMASVHDIILDLEDNED